MKKNLLHGDIFVRKKNLISHHDQDILCTHDFYLQFCTNVLTFFLCFYFSGNAIKTVEKCLCYGLTNRPLLLMQISNDCNNAEQLLESFQEVLAQIQKNYKGKQVSYNCARKCLQNKPEFFFFYG